VTGEQCMPWKVSIAAAVALWLATIVGAPAAMETGWDSMKRLIRSAYFSDACRQEAKALGIAGTSDANALFAAFATLGRPIASGADHPDAERDDCRAPVVLLINLLRLNGIDAELVFASMSRASAADGAPPDKIDRVLVYVPERDRYFDPAAPLGKQAVLDQIIVEKATRSHLVGPSLAGDAHDACRDTCMRVYRPRSGSSVRVKTEMIRGR
jgi:hypothetical protein